MTDIQAHTAQPDGDGGYTQICPFCKRKTKFRFRYNGLLCEYRSKCTHVHKVDRSASPNLLVFYECTAAEPSSSNGQPSTGGG